MLAAGALGAWLTVAAEEGVLVRANATATVIAAVLLAAGLVLRVPLAIPVSVALLGAEYIALLGFEGEALDTRAPLVAGALLAVAELGYWSLELHGSVADEPGTYLRRIALLSLLLLAVIGLGIPLLALVESVSADGALVDLVGAVAAVGALALVALAARRTVR